MARSRVTTCFATVFLDLAFFTKISRDCRGNVCRTTSTPRSAGQSQEAAFRRLIGLAMLDLLLIASPFSDTGEGMLGSNPNHPAKQSKFQRVSFLGTRKACQMRAGAQRHGRSIRQRLALTATGRRPFFLRDKGSCRSVSIAPPAGHGTDCDRSTG